MKTAWWIRCEWKGHVWTVSVRPGEWTRDPALYRPFRSAAGAQRELAHIPLRTGQHRWVQSCQISEEERETRETATQRAHLLPA